MTEYSQCRGAFLNAVFEQEKRLFRTDVIKQATVPKFKEFSNARLYDQCKKDSEVMSYIPELEMSKKQPDWKYICDVLNMVRSNFVETNCRLCVENPYQRKGRHR